jgi:hypothetical protein
VLQVHGVVDSRRSPEWQGIPVFDSGDVLLSSRVRQLKDERASVMAHAVANRPPKWNPLIAVDHRVGRQDAR